MNRAHWSSLLLGTFLATAGSLPLRAEEATASGAVEHHAEAAPKASDDDLSTGSIEQLKRAANTPGLVPLQGARPASLKEIGATVAPAQPEPPKAPASAPSAPSAVEPAPAPVVAPAENAPAPATPPAPTAAAPSVTEGNGTTLSRRDAFLAAARKAAAAAAERAAAESTATTEASPPVTVAPVIVAPVSAPASAAPEAASSAPATEVAAPPAAPSESTPAPATAAIPLAEPVKPSSEIAANAAPEAAAKPDAVTDAKAEAKPDAKTEITGTAVAPAPTVTAAVAPAATVPTATPIAPAAPTASATAAPATAVAAAPAAAPPATPTAPASTLTPREADVAATQAAQVDADALKKVVEAHAGEAGAADDKRERAAVAAFYAERRYAPLFLAGDDLGPRGRAVAERFHEAGLDGLEPRDYRLAPLKASTPEARAEGEYQVAVTALRFARHIRTGRFDPTKVSDLVTPTPPKTDAAAVLAEMSTAADAGAVLAAQAPTHEGYKRLRTELARLRGEAEVPVVRLPPGPVLKPGAKDARVAMLRERLGVTNTVTDGPDVFDPSLAEAVKSFQRERGIAANGALNKETLAALNDESRGNGDKIADVVVNMERWRWLPRELGAQHVFVNIPDFHLDVMRDGKSVHHARVVTGRPENQTPIFSETMKTVVVNPYWHVPYSIVKKEMMARLQGGRGLGSSFEVEVGNRRVDPGAVDWNTVAAEHVSIRQRPGDGNALGNIKFLFPNKHSVYIHDTSSRSLFAQSYRALSHGCVRVHEPFSFADAVLSQEPTALGGAQLKKLIGGAEREIGLKVQVPVHINYFTVWVDDAGQVQARRDIYGHDAKMKRILGL